MDAVTFHNQHYQPNGTFLVLTGNFDLTDVQQLTEKHFSQWMSSPVAKPVLQFSLTEPTAPRTLLSTIPGKAEAITLMAHVGIERLSPLYYAAVVVNQMLGGDTLSS